VLAQLDRVRLVLCRPRNPQNLGAAARAMRCAGLSRWTIVDPRTLDFETARRVAVHAEELLDKPQVVESLPEALRGCALTIATTARTRPERPLLSPREAAQALSACPGEVALVFGDERSGLTAEEVEAVDLVSRIPSSPEQPSWNLAQAIAIYSYELRAAMLEVPGQETAGSPAHPGQLASVDRALGALLGQAGREATRRRLSRSLLRAQLSKREAQLWTAVLSGLRKRQQ